MVATHSHLEVSLTFEIWIVEKQNKFRLDLRLVTQAISKYNYEELNPTLVARGFIIVLTTKEDNRLTNVQ